MDGKWCGLNHPLHGKSHTSMCLTFGCMNKFTLPLSITHLVPNLQELSIPLYSHLKDPITYPLTTSNSLELLARTFFQHIHTNIICSKTNNNNKHQHSIIIIIIIIIIMMIPFHARKTPNMTPTPFDVFLQWFTPHLLWQDQMPGSAPLSILKDPSWVCWRRDVVPRSPSKDNEVVWPDEEANIPVGKGGEWRWNGGRWFKERFGKLMLTCISQEYDD